jgi:hypothetical protein
MYQDENTLSVSFENSTVILITIIIILLIKNMIYFE